MGARPQSFGLHRFIFGSTKVMKVALGQSDSEEYQIGLAEVAETLRGNVGLFFTNLAREEVRSPQDLCKYVIRRFQKDGLIKLFSYPKKKFCRL